MDIQEALIAFDALSQETRLKVFRLLVEHGPEGAPAGTISEALGIPHNTLSFHLNHMSNADLIVSRREGRSIIYSANYEGLSGLVEFLMRDCCQGRPEVCAPAALTAAACCAPTKEGRSVC